MQGDLFLLEKYIFFVSKQPTLLELSDIHQVVFSRLGAGMGASAARTFDIKIMTKGGTHFTFTSVNKEEHEVVNAYLQDKKVKTKNEMMEGELIMGPDDDEDAEMQSVASSGEEVPKPRRGGDDDDDSEDGKLHTPFFQMRIQTLITYSAQTRTSRRLIPTPARPRSRTRPTKVAKPPQTQAATATS